jgi:hypothetical protein
VSVHLERPRVNLHVEASISFRVFEAGSTLASSTTDARCGPVRVLADVDAIERRLCQEHFAIRDELREMAVEERQEHEPVGAWLVPTTVVAGRFATISATLDF